MGDYQKILIVTPLFPPDIGGAAAYVKELATRLSEMRHVSILAYGHLPEKVDGVSVHTVDKRLLLPIRLLLFFIKLVRHARHADTLYVENGSSVELPVLVLHYLLRTPFVLHIGDPDARQNTSRKLFRGYIHRLLRTAAKTTIETSPKTRPEILPFRPFPQEAMDTYETSWKAHMTTVDHDLA